MPHGDEITKPLNIIVGMKGLTELRRYTNYDVVKYPDATTGVRLHAALPWRIYATIVGLFKKVNELHNTEALVYVWRKASGEFAITVPDQEVSAAEAKPLKKIIEPPEGEGWIFWGHIHSHNTMTAFFSGTDNGSETQEGMVYGVVGKITDTMPETEWRIRAAGQWLKLKFDTVVILPQSVYPAPADRWLEKIRKPAPVMVNDYRHHFKSRNDEEYEGEWWKAWNRVNHKETKKGKKDPKHSRAASLPGAFRRICRKDGRIQLEWVCDGFRLSDTGKRLEDLSEHERRLMYVEGVDWFPREMKS